MRQLRKRVRDCSGVEKGGLDVGIFVVVVLFKFAFAGGRGIVNGDAAIAREAASRVSKIATVWRACAGEEFFASYCLDPSFYISQCPTRNYCQHCRRDIYP